MTKQLDRATVQACIDFVENGSFLNSDSPPARFAKECARAMRSELLSNAVSYPVPKEGKIESLYALGQLREFTKDAPDTALIRCQVVGQNGGAWNMYVGLHNHGGTYHLRVYHPELTALPDFDPPKRTLYKLRDQSLNRSTDNVRWYIESISPGGVHLKTPLGTDTHMTLKTFMDLYVEE